MPELARRVSSTALCVALAALQCQAAAPIETGGDTASTPPPVVPTREADAAAKSNQLQVDIVVPTGASRILVLGWYTESEAPMVKPLGHP